MRFCPNKSSELYKELLKINNNSQGLATGAYSVITTLQDKGLLSEKRFNLNGKMVYTIPMKNYDINSIPQQLKGNFSKEKNIDAALELERYLTERHLSWIQTKETTNTYIIELKPIPVTERQSQMFNLAPSTPMYNTENIVQYSPKVLEVVQKNLIKLNIWFKQLKDTDQFWKKVQSDLAIPKEQVELLRQSKGDTIEQKLVDFVSKYSYTVEINTAKEQKYHSKFSTDYIDFILDNDKYEFNDFGILSFTKNGKEIGEKKYSEAMNEYNKTLNKLTQYYSNLTVPGGTNYTENEISTPAITPSIKGHAQFSTDKGIGWFRGDDKSIGGELYQQAEQAGIEEMDFDEDGRPMPTYASRTVDRTKGGTTTKTRRILEVQSDLFQKGRDKKQLDNIDEGFDIDNVGNRFEQFTIDGIKYIGLNGNYSSEDSNDPFEVVEKTITKEEFLNKFKEYRKLNPTDNTKNQFLQLLNKDNNWVTFFIKSIIQDTAKQTVTEVQESDVEAKVRELEKDGLLEIDCKGKLKAEKGLQTNFTKGGKWKLIKDLKGYPTHKEGGVDLTISKNGVSIKNGNTEFTAKHGLVIPKN